MRDLRDLRGRQVSPEAQRDDLAILLVEQLERPHDKVAVGKPVVGRVDPDGLIDEEPLERRAFDLSAPVVIAQPIERDRVQPCRLRAPARVESAWARRARSKTSPTRSSASARSPVR